MDTTRKHQDYLQARFFSCHRIMSSHRNNWRTCETPILQIDSATFQAAVIAVVIVVVTAVMAQLNANNTNEYGNGVDNSNHNNNQGNQRATTQQGTPNPKPKIMNEKGSSSNQRPTKRKKLKQPLPPSSPLPQHRENHIKGTSRTATSATTTIMEPVGSYTAIGATRRGTLTVSVELWPNTSLQTPTQE